MPNRLPGPSRALSRCPNSGKTGSRGCSPLSRTTTRSCRDKSGSAASFRSGRCKNLMLVRRSSAQRRHPAPAPDETKAALPFAQLAFAGTEVALDATVIEAVPRLPENDSRLDHLAMACSHTLPSHSAKLSQHRRSTGANSRSAWSRDSTRSFM